MRPLLDPCSVLMESEVGQVLVLFLEDIRRWVALCDEHPKKTAQEIQTSQ